MPERIQRALSRAGLASRRRAEDLVGAGRVLVNGEPAHIGQVVDTGRDQITVDGRPLAAPAAPVYLLLHKPKGYTTSLRDRHAERLVTDLVPAKWGRVFPVGRLDRDTTGLLLLTNDGELAHRLMHPRYGVDKVYEAWVSGRPGPVHLNRLRRGLMLEEGPAAPRSVHLVRTVGGETLLRIVLAEGRKREVRRLLEAVGHPVAALRRVAYAGLSLDGVDPGECRPLTHAEVLHLKQMVSLADGGRRGAGEAPRGGRPVPRGPAGASRRIAPRAPAPSRQERGPASSPERAPGLRVRKPEARPRPAPTRPKALGALGASPRPSGRDQS